jgi:hypothetical protein
MRVSNFVGLATEPTETFEFYLTELSELCGEVAISPFFWAHLRSRESPGRMTVIRQKRHVSLPIWNEFKNNVFYCQISLDSKVS